MKLLYTIKLIDLLSKLIYIINIVKLLMLQKFIKSLLKFKLYKYSSFNAEDLIDIKFNFKLIKNNNQKIAYDIHCLTLYLGDLIFLISMAISLNKKFYPMAYNDLIISILSCLKHEFLHISQLLLLNTYLLFDEKDKTILSLKGLYLYLTSKDLVLAFVQLFSYKSEKLKRNFKLIIDLYIDGIGKILTGSLIQKIKNLWIRTAKDLGKI